jgi:hypothetical protein
MIPTIFKKRICNKKKLFSLVACQWFSTIYDGFKWFCGAVMALNDSKWFSGAFDCSQLSLVVTYAFKDFQCFTIVSDDPQ